MLGWGAAREALGVLSAFPSPSLARRFAVTLCQRNLFRYSVAAALGVPLGFAFAVGRAGTCCASAVSPLGLPLCRRPPGSLSQAVGVYCLQHVVRRKAALGSNEERRLVPLGKLQAPS